MRVKCEKCHAEFDDARCDTQCPHFRFLPDDLIKQKDLALSLFGEEVCFNHMLDGPRYRIQSVGWDGMVTLAGEEMTGQFAPHLFAVVK